MTVLHFNCTLITHITWLPGLKYRNYAAAWGSGLENTVCTVFQILSKLVCVQIHSLLITQWCDPWHSTHTLPRRSLHSKCHVLWYTRQCIFNNAHKTSTTFPAPNSMKPISDQQHRVKMYNTEFHPHRTIRVGSTNSFTPLSKKLTPLYRLSQKSKFSSRAPVCTRRPHIGMMIQETV